MRCSGSWWKTAHPRHCTMVRCTPSSALICSVGWRRSSGMLPSDDPFYARLRTLSDTELCTYIQHYAHYKVDAVHAALAELRTRGVPVSQDALAEIDRY